jgi:CRP-like cAMP-binding protein
VCAAATQVLQALAGVSLFAGLDVSARRRLAEGAELREFSGGDVICREGDPGTGLHLVTRGQVKLLLQAGNGHEKVFDLISAGASFGEPSLYTEQPHQVTAQAITETQLIHISRAEMLKVLRETPELALRVINGLASRIYRRTHDLKSYMLMSGTQRVICYLLHEVPFEAEGAAEVAVTLPVRKGLIASRLNLTQEHFSRILHELAVATLIRVEGQRVHIRDVGQLRLMASG